LQAYNKKKVLFLCTGNSCRSQMAEGWSKALMNEHVDAYSAGIETHGLNPHAVAVMAEAGIDISRHQSKNIADLSDIHFDVIYTVCDHANQSCPSFTAATKVVHTPFDDPPKLAEYSNDEESKLDCYRQVRDEIKQFVESIGAPTGLN